MTRTCKHLECPPTHCLRGPAKEKRCVVCKRKDGPIKKRKLAHAADLTVHKHYICDACWLMLPEE